MQAAPTSNTVLHRLKQIQDSLSLNPGGQKVTIVDGEGNEVTGEEGNSATSIVSGVMNAMLERDTETFRFLTSINDSNDASLKRLAVQSELAPGSVIQTGTAFTGATETFRLRNNTVSPDFQMKVDGSVSNKAFTKDAESTDDLVLISLRVVFSAENLLWSGTDFGKGGGALTNGFQINVVADNGDINTTFATLSINEDFLRLLDFDSPPNSSTLALAASINFGGAVKLVAGSSDKVEVLIRDDMTTASRGVNYLTGTLYASREAP